MTKYLVVVAHANPNETSTSHLLARAAIKGLSGAGHEVRYVDLIKEGFLECASKADFKEIDDRFDYTELQDQEKHPNNIADVIVKQQENLKWANYLIVIGPMWFWHYPACFYAYFERIFTKGFHPFKDTKKVLLVTTCGCKADRFEHLKGITTVDGLMFTTTFSFNRCGLEVFRTLPIFDCTTETPKERLNKLEQEFVKVLLNIEKRPLLDFTPQENSGKDVMEIFASLPNLPLD